MNSLIDFINNGDDFTFKSKIHISKLNYNYIYDSLEKGIYHIYCNKRNEYNIYKASGDLELHFYSGKTLIWSSNKTVSQGPASLSSLESISNKQCWNYCLSEYGCKKGATIIYKDLDNGIKVEYKAHPIDVLIFAVAKDEDIIYSNIYFHNDHYKNIINKMDKYTFVQQLQKSVDPQVRIVLFHYFCNIRKFIKLYYKKAINKYKYTDKYDCFESFLEETGASKIYHIYSLYYRCISMIAKEINNGNIEVHPNIKNYIYVSLYPYLSQDKDPDYAYYNLTRYIVTECLYVNRSNDICFDTTYMTCEEYVEKILRLAPFNADPKFILWVNIYEHQYLLNKYKDLRQFFEEYKTNYILV